MKLRKRDKEKPRALSQLALVRTSREATRVVEYGVKASQEGYSLVTLWKGMRVRSPVTSSDPSVRHERNSTFAISFFCSPLPSSFLLLDLLKVASCLLVCSSQSWLHPRCQYRKRKRVRHRCCDSARSPFRISSLTLRYVKFQFRRRIGTVWCGRKTFR